jgi:hypothetical protein
LWGVAVRVGFEPTVLFPVRIFSKDVLSTTQPPHQKKIGPSTGAWSGATVGISKQRMWGSSTVDIIEARGWVKARKFNVTEIPSGLSLGPMMQFRVSAFLILCALMAVTPGCKLLGGKKSQVEEATSPASEEPTYRRYPLGEITFVNAEEGFVLIKTSAATKLPEGSLIESRNTVSGALASLELSPERKRTFLVADIKTGQPSVGDRVNLLIQIDSGEPF